MTGRSLLLCLALALVALAGCERSQVIVYKQGEYQGKADNQPWDNERFKGDKAAWETAIKARSLGQHEYKKVP